MASSIDETKPTATTALTADVRANFSAAKTEIEALQTDKAALADLASTATDDGTKGFHLVSYPPLSLETGVTNPEYKYGDVRRYGATGDGATDDTTAFVNAAASRKTVLIPNPSVSYKLASTVTFEDQLVYGESIEDCQIDYYGTGFCFQLETGQYGGGIHNLFLNSKTAGQSGIFVAGDVNPVLENLKVDNFDTIQLRIGNVSTSDGAYFGDYRNIYIRMNSGTPGTTAILIDGGTTPSSNANSFYNVFTNGEYTNAHIHIKGNNNHFYGGDCQWEDSASSTAIVKIEGSGNTFNNPYFEPAVDFLTPDTLIEFTSTAFGNDFYNLWLVGNTNSNLYSAIKDAGSGNTVKIKSRGFNFDSNYNPNTSHNLFANANLDIWQDANTPEGFHASTVRITQESTTVKYSTNGFKMTESASASTIKCYLIDAFSSSLLNIPLADLQGRDISAGVWVHTSVAGAGSVQIKTTGSAGGSQSATSNSVHSGGGDWELLTTTLLLADDITNVWIEYRSHITNANITGTVIFCAPTIVYGDTVPDFTRRSIPDNGGTILGDLDFYTGTTIDLPDSQTTVGAAGGGSALPATPTGYTEIKVAGTTYVVPYYAKS